MERELTNESSQSTSNQTITTTMGDLIEAITQIALQASKSQEEAYVLATLAVEEILCRNKIEMPKGMDTQLTR